MFVTSILLTNQSTMIKYQDEMILTILFIIIIIIMHVYMYVNTYISSIDKISF